MSPKKYWKKVKKIVRDFVLVPEEELKKIKEEETKKKSSNDIKKTNIKYGVYTAIIVVIVIMTLQVVNILNDSQTQNLNDTSSLINENLDYKEIKSVEIPKIMMDTLNGNIGINVSYTELDGNIAYSLTYGYGYIPEDRSKLQSTSDFLNEYVTTILVNGYPNHTAGELGLENDNEAYVATQLAIYEYISRSNNEDIIHKTFSLSKIKSIKQENKEEVERILKASNSILEKSINNLYENDGDSYIDVSNPSQEKKEDCIIVGPFYAEREEDDLSKKLLKDEKFFANIKTINFDDKRLEIVDENGKNINIVKNGDPFYIKITNYTDDSYFFQIQADMTGYSVTGKAFSNLKGSKRYAILSIKEEVFSCEQFIVRGQEYGKIDVYVKDLDSKPIKNVKLGVYDENNTLIVTFTTNNNGYGKTFVKTGNYTVREIDTPDRYLYNGNDFEAIITEELEKITIEIINESL